MMRVGFYRPVYVKTLRGQKLRMLLTHRKLLQSKAIAIENDLRGTLRNFGLKVGMVGKMKFEARVKELVESLPDLAGLVEPLQARIAIREPTTTLKFSMLIKFWRSRSVRAPAIFGGRVGQGCCQTAHRKGRSLPVSRLQGCRESVVGRSLAVSVVLRGRLNRLRLLDEIRRRIS